MQSTIQSVLAGLSLLPPGTSDTILKNKAGGVVPAQKPLKKEDAQLEQVVKDRFVRLYLQRPDTDLIWPVRGSYQKHNTD